MALDNSFINMVRLSVELQFTEALSCCRAAHPGQDVRTAKIGTTLRFIAHVPTGAKTLDVVSLTNHGRANLIMLALNCEVALDSKSCTNRCKFCSCSRACKRKTKI